MFLRVKYKSSFHCYLRSRFFWIQNNEFLYGMYKKQYHTANCRSSAFAEHRTHVEPSPRSREVAAVPFTSSYHQDGATYHTIAAVQDSSDHTL